MNGEIWDGFRERTTMLNPIFMLGKGMEVGTTLAPYLPQLLLAILLEVFYREIKDDDRRSRSDLVTIAKEIMDHQGLPHDDDKAERLINGLLSYGNPNLRNPFSARVFDPSTEIFNDKPFLYLTIDTEYRRKGAIYKLTQSSQNMIFLSREVILEFSIEFEQLYTLKLIRNNNFRSALQSLDVLITKIRQLISQEYDYRRNLHRNPRILMEQGKEARKERRDEINRQFEESNLRFDKMIRLLANVDLTAQEARSHILEMGIKVHATMALSAKLHAELYQNIELELSIRKYRPSAFMKRRSVSLKTDIWENELLSKGIPASDTMEKLLSPFFSPRTPFLYPMGLIWSEQEIHQDEGEAQEEDEPEDKVVEPKQLLDWPSLVRHWAPVIRHLIYTGEVSLRDISAKDWTVEALELWMIFKTDVLEIPHILTTYQPYEDERMELIRLLVKSDPFFNEIAGKQFGPASNKEPPYIFLGFRSPLSLLASRISLRRSLPMPFTAEQLNRSSAIFFHLLRNKMVDRKNDVLIPYFSEQEIHEATNIIAKQSGTMILETPTKLHLVVEPEGSVFASSFTQLKEKHSRIKNRDELDLLHILLMVLLCEMDGELLIRNEREISGITIYKWIELVDQTMTRWEQELNDRPEIESEWGIAIVKIKDMWFAKQPYEDGNSKNIASTKTKYSYCTLASNLLVEERLLRIIGDDDQSILLPTDDLYDRIHLLYHDHDRFKQFKSIIDSGRNSHAGN